MDFEKKLSDQRLFTKAVKQGEHSGFGLHKLIQKKEQQPSLKAPESHKLLIKYSRSKKMSETPESVAITASAKTAFKRKKRTWVKPEPYLPIE